MKKNKIIKILFVFIFFIQVMPMNLMASEITNNEQAIENMSIEQNDVEPINYDQEVEAINYDQEVEPINNEEVDMSQLARGADNLSLEKNSLQVIKDNLFLIIGLFLIIILGVYFLIRKKKQK